MLAAKFVEVEIRQWLEETRPNLNNPLEYLPSLALHIISAYEHYRQLVNPKNPYLFSTLNSLEDSVENVQRPKEE